MLSLGIYEDAQGALEAMGLNLEELIDEENPASVTVARPSGGLLPRFSGDVRVAGARLRHPL